MEEKKGEFIRYLSSSPAGDLISFLSGIRQLWMDIGKRGIIYQRLDMPGISYSDSIHPFQNAEGEPVCLNRYMFDMLRPLIISLPYIEDYRLYTGEEMDFNFDLIRQERYTNQPKGSLNRWPGLVFPQMTTDLSEKWIDIPAGISNPYKEKIVINFTQRHRNHILTYHWLREYQESIIFAGLSKERDLFCSAWNLDIPLLQVDNFYELAKIISGCKFFLGNQSFCFQLAEATKVPRILELFPLMPNVIPIGKKAFDFYHQSDVEHRFKQLFND